VRHELTIIDCTAGVVDTSGGYQHDLGLGELVIAKFYYWSERERERWVQREKAKGKKWRG
jgi:hypothetical protein